MPCLLCLHYARHHYEMKPNRRPGDLLLDRYFPNADAETRKRALEAFVEYVRVLEDLGRRIAARKRDSHESKTCDTIPSLNPSP